MLQRAASNAYSWWYASHVRTKQSKWLEQSLHDMGEKVEAMLKLIQEDGDSFAKRAEMYYKRRPELINFVEESYRAYRSLAERYDHISKELQNANTTLASAFPDQYQFPMDDDDDDDVSPRTRRRFNPRSSSNSDSNSNIPKAPPKFPSKNIKAIIALTSKANKAPPSSPAPKSHANRVPKSGLTMTEAISEIDKLQKQILTLQTEKEFAKSSYESGYAKYCDIDEQIFGTQEKISKLQDEFGVAQVIEDDEARTLMAEAAIKSCNDTLSELQQKQEKATAEAKTERQKIKDFRKKLNSFKGEVPSDQIDTSESEDPTKEEETSSFNDKAGGVSKDLEVLHDKLKEHFEVGESTSLSVLEMADKIDELVNKVINFESVMSSQTALIHTLKSETDELQLQIKTLEDDKANLIAGKTNLSDKLGQMENKLRQLEDSFEARSNEVKADKGEKAVSSTSQESKASIANDMSDLSPAQDGAKVEKTDVLESKDKSSVPLEAGDIQPQVSKSSNKPKDQLPAQKTPNKKEQEEAFNPRATQPGDQSSNSQEVKPREVPSVPKDETFTPLSKPLSGERIKEDDEPDWQHLFTNGLESKEKVLLAEYTTTLRNYKETKKKLSEIEMKKEEYSLEVEKQLKELKTSLAMRDEEIRSLRNKLSILQKKLEEQQNEKEKVESAPRIEDPSPPPEDDVDIKAMFPAEREISPVEQKLRADIDEILEENLDFWMRFSGSFGQVQKFQNVVEDLQAELAKIEKSHEKKEGSSHGGTQMNSSLKSEVKPIYKHMREVQTELTVWLEESEKLKEELQRRFSQLCHIQEEIKHALSAGAEDDDMKFTNFQAVKFQGEVANMQQENNKVADELQAGIDYITSLQLEIQRTTTRLNEQIGFSTTQSQKENENRPGNQPKVPLKSFIFGNKPQKKKQSIFSCMHPAMMNRRYHHLKPDKSPSN